MSVIARRLTLRYRHQKQFSISHRSPAFRSCSKRPFIKPAGYFPRHFESLATFKAIHFCTSRRAYLFVRCVSVMLFALLAG